MSFMKWFGMLNPNGSSVRAGGSESWPDGTERYFGLENFGNTCYCNSVLQALYFCRSFRTCVSNYPELLASPGGGSSSPEPPASREGGGGKPPSSMGRDFSIPQAPEMGDNLFRALKDLFKKIETQKRKSGVVSPDAFVQKLRKENQLFSGTMQQDAHEFLNYTLNAIAEDVLKYEKALAAHRVKITSDILTSPRASQSPPSSPNGGSPPRKTSGASVEEIGKTPKTTWVHQLFEGVLSNETKCLTCESVTNRDESFLDLSIDIERHHSVTACLKAFSASEMLCHRNKFYCDTCVSLQEAEKRMKIKRLPRVLALHLKRFKYMESMGRHVKLGFRVTFPLELRLFNTSDDTEDPDRLYELFAIVVHIGGGPHQGHYVTLVRSMGRWMLFDDGSVDMIEEADIANYFGGDNAALGSGYVLFYQMADGSVPQPTMSTTGV